MAILASSSAAQLSSLAGKAAARRAHRSDLSEIAERAYAGYLKEEWATRLSVTVATSMAQQTLEMAQSLPPSITRAPQDGADVQINIADAAEEEARGYDFMDADAAEEGARGYDAAEEGALDYDYMDALDAADADGSAHAGPDLRR